MKKVLCKKSLFKSTYKKNAFTESMVYFVTYEDEKFYYIIDEKNHPMNFAKEDHGVFYFFDTYFEKV